MKNTTTVFVSASTTSYYQPVVSFKKGRYGIYAVLNGINRSEKFMVENGFEIKTISKDEASTLMQAWNNKNAEQVRLAHATKMNEREAAIAICLASAPIAISKKEKEICPTANLGGTPMIEAYQGCGKGTAYVRNNEVVAFHYGYEQPFAALALENVEAIKVELSCTQICFFTM